MVMARSRMGSKSWVAFASVQRTRPFSRGYLDGRALGSLLMPFPGTGNKGVTSPASTGGGLLPHFDDRQRNRG